MGFWHEFSFGLVYIFTVCCGTQRVLEDVPKPQKPKARSNSHGTTSTVKSRLPPTNPPLIDEPSKEDGGPWIQHEEISYLDPPAKWTDLKTHPTIPAPLPRKPVNYDGINIEQWQWDVVQSSEPEPEPHPRDEFSDVEPEDGAVPFLPGRDWRRRADKKYDEIKLVKSRRDMTSSAVQKHDYRVQIQKLDAEAREYNALAAKEVFHHLNRGYPENGAVPADARVLDRCDLHHLYVLEAKQYLNEHLSLCRKVGVKHTLIITGRGKHAKTGKSKLKQAVGDVLEKMRGVEIVDTRDGGSFSVSIS